MVFLIVDITKAIYEVPVVCLWCQWCARGACGVPEVPVVPVVFSVTLFFSFIF
jgi:hypothetical protein